MLLHHRQPIAWPRHRGATAAMPSPSRPTGRLAPALLMAIIAHLLAGAGLAAWCWTAPSSTANRPLRFQVFNPPDENFVGFDPPPVCPPVRGGGGNLAPPPVPAPSPLPPMPNLPDPPAPVLTFPPVIAVTEEIVPAYNGPTVSPLFSNAPTDFGEAGTGAVASVGSGGSAGGPCALGGTGIGAGSAYRRPPRPRYPAQARQNGWEGTTVLRVAILPTGLAGTVEVARSSGHDCLDEAAREAVRGARFAVDHPGWVEIPITFRLTN